MIHNHEWWWRFFPKKELTQVYLSLFLRSFAISLIGIFVPIYFYQELGFSLVQTLSFYAFYSVVMAASMPLAASFASRFGVKHSVMLSMPLYIIFLFLMYLMPTLRMNLMIPAAIVGISLAFYWTGMHLTFYHASDHQHRGEEFGKREGLTILAGLVGPLLGGLMIISLGFKSVFLLSSVILILSSVIIFRTDDEYPTFHFSVRTMWDKKYWQNSLFFVCRGSQVMANGVIWPLFVFSVVGGYFSLGLMGSILSAVTALLLFIVGKFSDHVDKRAIIRGVAGFESLSWILKAFSTTSAHIFGATIFGAITNGIQDSPLGALEYDKAKGEPLHYFVSRELFISLGRILMVLVVIMLNSLSGGLLFQSIINLAALLF